MKTYEVKYSVNGESGYRSETVKAPNSSTARRVAQGKIEGQSGYKDKKIRISAANEIR